MQTITDFTNIKTTGRWHTETIGGKSAHICYSSGNSIYFKISGTTSFGFDFNPRTDPSGGGSMIFEYSIDGGAFVRSGEITTSPATLATGLSTGEHTVEVVLNIPYYSLAWDNHYGAQINGVYLDNGGSVSAWDRAWAGKALWIGDSIVEGEQSIAAGDISNLKKGSRETYAWKVSRALNMEHHTWAFGGMGMTKYYGGVGMRSMPLLATNISYKMGGVLANDDPVFDWVVIQVCVNDYDVSTATFNAAYSAFIDTIKARWPAAQIYCIGPMPITMFLTQAAGVQSIAAAKGAIWIDPTSWASLINGHLHPLDAEHTAIANEISSSFFAPIGTTTTTTAAPATTTTTTPAPAIPGEVSLRLNQAPGGALRMHSGEKTLYIGLGSDGPIRTMASTGVVGVS